MTSADASRLLRENLLADTTILLAGASRADGEVGGPFVAAVREACSGLGARVGACAPSVYDGEDAPLEAGVEQALERLGALDVLVIDAASLFAAAGAHAAGTPHADESPGRAAGRAGAVADAGAAARAMLVGSLQASWNITQAVADRAFLAPGRPGRIVYLAPAPGAGRDAEAARAGLENLARTLSIEWARYAITPVTIAPGEDTAAGEVAALTAYLASPAGAYFSGCLLDLRGPGSA
jgi:NAD(P)-dependent dehydrogenase (short-subunit alcohol dehydrogenase family)